MKGKKTNLRTLSPFTLIELLAAMGVFSLIMLVLISFFSAAQQAWTSSNARADVYENARVALDLMSRDIQCIYYVEKMTPFWHGAYADAGWDKNRNHDVLAFVTSTSSLPNAYCESKLCEVKYQLACATDHSDTDYDGWLRRSITGDRTDSDTENKKWNFYGNFAVGRTSSNDGSGYPDKSFTMDGSAAETTLDSSMQWDRVIPNVISLNFNCYQKDGQDMEALDYQYDSNGDGAFEVGTRKGKSVDPGDPYPTPLPYYIRISLTLMDSVSWKKWSSIDPTPYDATTPLTADEKGTNESEDAWQFRKNNQRTFTKTVFIGDRGQAY